MKKNRDEAELAAAEEKVEFDVPELAETEQ